MLIVTLLVTAMLVAVIVEYAWGVYIAAERAAIYRDTQRAGLLASNGVELTGRALEELLRGRPNMTMDEDGLEFTRTEDAMDVSIRVVDELSRLSTRVVYEKTGVENERASKPFANLVENLGLDPGLLDTLSDWQDADDEPRIYGAEEAGHYSVLPRPYGPRNGYLKTLNELRMVKGFTPEVYGRVERFVSPYNTSGLVNINTAPKEVLMALSPEITEELAAELIRRRGEEPFRDSSEIMKVPGFETIGFGLQGSIAVTSRLFRVYSTAEANGSVRQVEAVVNVGGGILYWREG